MNATTRGTRPHASGRSMTPRILTTLAATIAMLLTLVSGAQAGGNGFVEAGLDEGGLFYGNFDEDVLLFAGGTAVDFCNGIEPTHDARLFFRADGGLNFKVDNSLQPIYLYSTPLGAPEFVGATCEALEGGADPVEPFAQGEGRVRMRLDIQADGSVHVVNSTVGTASSDDGTTWKVRGWADLLVVGGVPQGSPEDFQGLRIAKTGS